MLSFVIAMMQE